MLLETKVDTFEMLNDLTKRGFVPSDDRTNALLMRSENLVVTLSPFRGENQQGHAPILWRRRAFDQAGALQAIRDCRDVALISEQQSTQVNHGQSVSRAQVMQRPELPGAQAILPKELTISIIEQVEEVGEQ